MTTYHFVGIKGSGMSALAQILHDMHHTVQGSDVDKRFFTQRALEERCIPLLPFQKENVYEGQTLISSNAYPDHHEEIQQARELQLPSYRYHDFLGEFMKGFTSVAVTGSHGKTSTTGLMAYVLAAAEPTSFLIGDGTGKGEPNSRYFVFEACEYRRHFLSYRPAYCIMTNVDFDHPDYFADIHDVFSAFQQMAMQVGQSIIACGDDEYLQKLEAKVPIIFYGLKAHNEFQAKDVSHDANGTSFDVFFRDAFYGHFQIPGYGTHSVLNALAVIVLCYYEEIPVATVVDRLQTFPGVKRRFSEKQLHDQVLIDDYAHHPTEVKATIEAVKQKYPDREVVAVFQPHTFTRTEAFLDEFANSLRIADQVYLCDIFSSARENKGSLTITDLQDKVPSSQLISEEDIERLGKHSSGVLLFMGAGDIQKFQQAYEQFSHIG